MKVSYIIIPFVLIAVSGCITSELPSTYTDPNGFFSVGIATGWTENKESGNITQKIVGLGIQGIGVSIFQIKKGNIGLVFVAASLPQQLSEKPTTDILIAGLQAKKIIPEGSQIKSRSFGNLEGKEVVLDGVEANKALSRGASIVKAKYIFAVSGGKIITIFYISENNSDEFSKNLGEAESMINTFKLLK